MCTSRTWSCRVLGRCNRDCSSSFCFFPFFFLFFFFSPFFSFFFSPSLSPGVPREQRFVGGVKLVCIYGILGTYGRSGGANCCQRLSEALFRGHIQVKRRESLVRKAYARTTAMVHVTTYVEAKAGMG
ncbi:hypothetical protein LZ32DRAFT_69816 [Colletotrichum eremochloae]|nr:hypothetical protein LZ32DRAFT_69816 [Colletotrichum eremochloae]